MQIQFHFDKETTYKIIIGALIAGSASIMIFLLNFLSSTSFQSPELNAFIAFFVPTIIYLVKKWSERKIELKKVLLSMFLALTGSVAILVAGNTFGSSADAIIALIVPFTLNSIKEWFRGVPAE